MGYRLKETEGSIDTLKKESCLFTTKKNKKYLVMRIHTTGTKEKKISSKWMLSRKKIQDNEC